MNITTLLLSITLTGGEWILWLLVGLSFFSFAIILERAFFYYSTRMDYDLLKNNVLNLLSNKPLPELTEYLKTNRSFESSVIRTGLDQWQINSAEKHDVDVFDKIVESQILQEKKRFQKGLVVLATIGNNAPFIGLLGTVLGIIKAFHDLALSPEGGANVVMSGISEALIATAVGLFVAIPAVLANNFFQKKVKNLTDNAISLEKLIMAHVKSKNG